VAIPKVAIQALLAGAAIGLLVKVLRRPSEPEPVDCSTIGPNGGTLNGIKYLETVRGGSDASVPMPMVVVFHSRGATAQGAASFPGLAGPTRIIRPSGFNKTEQGGNTWFTRSSKTDPEGLTQEMKQRAQELQAFIGALMRCRPTTGRPIVTGSSEGGHVSYLLASEAPGLVAGAVALLGYVPPGIWNSQMAPTVGLHTTGDNTVPYARTQAYWDAMKQAGASLETQTWAGGHSVVPGMGTTWRAAVQAMAESQRGVLA
jgi:predicted esterase